MNAETARQHENELCSTIREIYLQAGHDCWSSDELSKALKDRLWSTPVWAKVPRYVKEHINGWDDCLYQEHQKLLWFVMPWNGILYSTFCDLPKDGYKYYLQAPSDGLQVYLNNPGKRFTGKKELYDAGKVK